MVPMIPGGPLWRTIFSWRPGKVSWVLPVNALEWDELLPPCPACGGDIRADPVERRSGRRGCRRCSLEVIMQDLGDGTVKVRVV